MRSVLSVARRWGLQAVLAICGVHLAWLLHAAATAVPPDQVRSQRNGDFPGTFVSRIHLDLTAPGHYVSLTWSGPNAARQPSGPFCSSPGAGWDANDCDDPIESNCTDSRCTPKGLRKVEGFADFLKDTPIHLYVTWIDKQRRIAFHSCPLVESYPSSSGCVRLEPYAARLIHDNSIEGVTEILIDGTWTRARSGESEAVKR